MVYTYKELKDLAKYRLTRNTVKRMKKKHHTKLVHEGKYVAEVEVELLETNADWSPYLSMEDAYKLDDVREALRRGDIEYAARFSRVFTLTPVTA